jgi:hypothetical protein
MATDRGDILIQPYLKAERPALEESIKAYIDGELQKLQETIDLLTEAAVTVTDVEPTAPRVPSVRYQKQPWDPFDDGSEGLVYWDGASWNRL